MFSRQTFKASGIRELAWVAMTALVVAGAPPSTQPKPMAQHGVTTNRAPVEAGGLRPVRHEPHPFFTKPDAREPGTETGASGTGKQQGPISRSLLY